METFHDDGTPLAAYLEGEGTYEQGADVDGDVATTTPPGGEHLDRADFAPPTDLAARRRKRTGVLHPLDTGPTPQTSLGRLHNAWSTAVNSRLGRADNARFLEHFRYTIVASQLLNEYLDHGSLQSAPAPIPNVDGLDDQGVLPAAARSLYGATATATFAFALVYLLHWARNGRSGFVSKGRLALALVLFVIAGLVGYAFVRRQLLKYLRKQAVGAGSTLTTSWQTFETTSGSAISFVQEVELVSKGYRLSTPLAPASRIEDTGAARRCGRLRKALHSAYDEVIPACIAANRTLSDMVDQDDLERYYEVYDIGLQDANGASGSDALSVLEGDAESLRSLRVLSYRAGVLRRITFCALMSLKADGGKPDFARWSAATEIMDNLTAVTASSAERIRKVLSEMEHVDLPSTPIAKSPHGHGAARERMRSQVRKISTLSSGIKGLQAKMQILREETNRSIEQSEDLTDLGPHLMAQYDSIGADLKELVQAWETGKASLASNITKHERRISMASSGLRSPVSSLGGLTAVDEDGSPAAALRALTGDVAKSNRSSMGTTSTSEDEVFEAIAMPRQRSAFTREERIAKMHEDRERQATMRAKRDTNTNMLKELETVINLRPKKAGVGPGRILSI